ncbi:heat shock protein DnaJ domain protein [Sulfuricurvum kujiense DSM 16994]|uniref:Heat shock protein DnaJ domain protein n=1 Tax=Sulfuricurvum kujiense (strain ATCC BAA-921 / DSM 16994 / JCM 11577 / YK-1) TaxID=709032 RepID=E4TWE3_SULKY|nr:DnaJ domain-containing protein [Sulfuricurvum kujiense]ADR33761.1 heat shock protein DnaJ domain protein [Sulfuricurvum kujiense DSM 16994]
MQEIEYEEWIIWNASLGIRDFVTIGRIDTTESVAWLDAPYDMVGPFSLDELITDGFIRFAACAVMSKQRWQTDREALREEALNKRRKAQKEFYDELERHNRRKINAMQCSQREYRSVLNLPQIGALELSQIKSAYRKAAKKAHPDAGGSQEMFIRIKEACDALLELV